MRHVYYWTLLFGSALHRAGSYFMCAAIAGTIDGIKTSKNAVMPIGKVK